MRKRWFATGAVVAATAAVVLGGQTAAQAETRGANWVRQDTATGYCEASVNTYVDSSGSEYAYGHFENFDAGWNCTGWLERSTDDGHSWYTISGYHVVSSLGGTITDTDATGGYYDGPGYLARACFHLDFSGAATHCTYEK